VVGDT